MGYAGRQRAVRRSFTSQLAYLADYKVVLVFAVMCDVLVQQGSGVSWGYTFFYQAVHDPIETCAPTATSPAAVR